MMNSHGTAGKNAREMAQQRYKKVTIYAAVLFIISLLLFTNLNIMVKFGLPVSILIVIAVKFVADRIESEALYVKKRAKDADRGACAEEEVAERLMNLPDGYQVFHDIVFDGFNIDHIVVGPGGIFLVETESHKGKIDAQGDTLLLDGAQPPKNFLNQTWSQTYQISDFLKKQTSRDWKVQPILCFTRAFVSVRRPVKGITVVNKKYLTTYLLKQQQSLNSEDIKNITRILQSWVSQQDKPV